MFVVGWLACCLEELKGSCQLSVINLRLGAEFGKGREEFYRGGRGGRGEEGRRGIGIWVGSGSWIWIGDGEGSGEDS